MAITLSFDFLTPEQNKQLSESIELFVGLEIDKLRSDNDALQKRCAELDVRCSQLKRAEREREARLEVAKERISEMNLELMDSHRANVTLRESLAKEREHVVKLSAPRPSEVDAQELRSRNEAMSGMIKKLKEELRAANSELREYKDFVKRLTRTMETAPENMKEVRAMWRRQTNPLEPMLKPEAVGDIGGPA